MAKTLELKQVLDLLNKPSASSSRPAKQESTTTSDSEEETKAVKKVATKASRKSMPKHVEALAKKRKALDA
jgi:protein required for attachment to host cells